MNYKKTLLNFSLRTTVGLMMVISLLLISSCDDFENKTKKETDWVKEEILEQLTELRKDVKSLKDDIKKMDEKLSTVGKRRVAKAPKQVKLGSGITLGNDKAKIAIVEFTDYQCPFCARRSKTVLPKMKEKFVDSGKVKYVMYDFPLSFHKLAKSASVAARCAGKQGKYWEMHDEIFNNQRGLNNSLYKKTAASLKLNVATFNRCLKDAKVVKTVDLNIDYGNQLGVTGTPKFFVGKVDGNVIKQVVVISGAQGFSAFQRAVDKLK